LEVLHVDVIKSRVVWLMGHPAGLKSNVFMAATLGEAILSAMQLWNMLTSVLTPAEPFIVATLGHICGLMGITAICAGVADILGLITVHVSLFYSGLLGLYNYAVQDISTLWQLFRGKKKNMLREGRIDSCRSDLQAPPTVDLDPH
jgi:phosphatidylinositol glycan class Q protein